jgi:NAD(P)-dependent dehydrogenase (short-subunit alcohol dehydrogenase family)
MDPNADPHAHGSASAPQLAGRVAVVTGAAFGLGREIARVYAEAGAKVVVADVATEQGEETVRLITSAGGEAIFISTDVSDPQQVRDLMDGAEAAFGALHVVTANAGILGRGHDKAFTDLDDDDFAQIMNVNFHGIRYCFKYAIAPIRRSGGGALTATSSLAAHRGYRNLAAYSSSKGAVIALVRALAAELYPEIRVNAVSPGAIGTDMRRRAADAGASGSEARKEPFGGRADPRQVAWPHLFLASNHGSFVNGQVLIADGGRSIIPATAS